MQGKNPVRERKLKVTIESTTQIVTCMKEGKEIPARLWQGLTESGIPVECLIIRIAAPTDRNLEQFEAELKECIAPAIDVQAFPIRMIL
jgi:hypothetical protein